MVQWGIMEQHPWYPTVHDGLSRAMLSVASRDLATASWTSPRVDLSSPSTLRREPTPLYITPSVSALQH